MTVAQDQVEIFKRLAVVVQDKKATQTAMGLVVMVFNQV
jgi:hypothetical protein